MVYSLRSFALLALASSLGFAAHSQTLAQAGPTTPPSSAVPLTSAPAAPVVYPDSVYVNPEVRPQFMGGDKAFVAYLTKSIRYPALALQRRTSGKVYVSFILNAQGRVLDAHVMRGPGNGLNEEALRLVWLMPAWEPARMYGQPVRVACTIPIAFNSEN